MQQRKVITGPLQFTGHKYKYVSNQDIVDTDEKYIKNLERQIEQQTDYWNWSVHEYHMKTLPLISSLKRENRELKIELKMIKKFIEEAKRKTNQQF
tara:strand:- start:509 stop:796 length:288 start_codon:yes stop_codon:yes gene_type:complete